MADRIILQDLLTACGVNHDYTFPIVPHQDNYADLSSFTEVGVDYAIFNPTSGVVVKLETAPTIDSSIWSPTVEDLASKPNHFVLRRRLGLSEKYLDNFLRWRVDPGILTTAWEVGFRIYITPKY